MNFESNYILSLIPLLTRPPRHQHPEVWEAIVASPGIALSSANTHGLTALHTAARCQRCIYVKYVYLSNIDLLLHLLQIWSGRGDSIASSPARDPCQFQNDSGGFLFSERVAFFHQGSSPLLVGAKYGNVEAVKLLLKDERVDVALQDNQGRSTPS